MLIFILDQYLNSYNCYTYVESRPVRGPGTPWLSIIPPRLARNNEFPGDDCSVFSDEPRTKLATLIYKINNKNFVDILGDYSKLFGKRLYKLNILLYLTF